MSPRVWKYGKVNKRKRKTKQTDKAEKRPKQIENNNKNMTRFIRLWNSPQGGSFNFRFPCKNLIRIQLIATNLSWLVYFASLMEDELRRKTDTIILYNNAISREFQSQYESGAFVGKSIFSLWTLACQTKVIWYAVSVTKWFYRQI